MSNQSRRLGGGCGLTSPKPSFKPPKLQYEILEITGIFINMHSFL